MKIYSYVITHDTGFAPNPYGHALTLACCKPKLRQTAQIGDIILATGSTLKIGWNKLVYLMEVTEKMTFTTYFSDPRFQDKIPLNQNDHGDNIYKPIGTNEYQQLPSRHSRRNGTEYISTKNHDLSCLFVLISKKFTYYGASAISIPNNLDFIIKKGPGHKCKFTTKEIESCLIWLQELDFPLNIKGDPYSD